MVDEGEEEVGRPTTAGCVSAAPAVSLMCTGFTWVQRRDDQGSARRRETFL